MTNNNSIAENSAPNPNDNLPARQKMIMERLTGIRSNKQRILDTLREMKEKLGEDEEPDKEMMGKMIASYDLLTGQEEEYMRIMQMIVTIRANAAEDVRQDVEEVNKAAKKEASGEAKSDSKSGPETKTGNQKDKEGQTTDKEKTVESKETADAKEQKRSGGTEEEWQEVEQELGMLGEVAGEAVAASVLNDRLAETLQLHKTKRAALEQMRQKQRDSQKSSANEALQQVEMARIKVASEQDEIERKQKTLERLRREAVRRGIKLEPGTASEPDLVLEAPPEPKSVTEAKLRAKLEAKKKQHEEADVEDNGPAIPDNLVPSERIPPIEELDSKVAADSANGGASGSSKKKKKGKRAKEQARDRREAINASIREKLASIEARKQRMREIQSKLVQPVISQDDMNETFLKAQERLKSLTAMREHLEELQETGEELPEETVALLEEQLEEDETETRKDDSGVAQAGADCLGPALDHIEQREPTTKSERQLCSAVLRQALLSSKPQVLVQFAETVVKLASSEVAPDLNETIELLLSQLDEPYSNQVATEEERCNEGQVQEVGAQTETNSATSELNEPIKQAPAQPTSNVDTENGNERSLKDQRIEQARRRLSTGKAKLQKQRTLERIRCLTGDEAGEEKEEPIGQENDICRVVEGVMPWIRDHAEQEGTETLMHELRDVIVRHASAICYPEGSASDLFDNQLSTIIDDTLSQYYGSKLNAQREPLIFDISEVLYNELAFFQLMQNIDNMADA